MPRYDYICDSCDHELKDIYQSFSEEALSDCPGCGKNTLRRVIYGGLATFVKNVTTIGQLADQNWNNKGSYEKSEIESQQKKKEEESPLSVFGSASKKQINKMSAEQKKKYIITGET